MENKERKTRTKKSQRIANLIQAYRVELEYVRKEYPQFCIYIQKLSYNSKKNNLERLMDGWPPPNIIGTTMFHVIGHDEELRKLVFQYIDDKVLSN